MYLSSRVVLYVTQSVLKRLQPWHGYTAGLPAPEPLPSAVLSPYKPSSLDNLLCYSHYLVHTDAPYLHQEQHARDYRAHLAIFATRAHLSDQTQVLSRGDIDRVVLDEIATKDAFDPASKSFATQLGKKCTGYGVRALSWHDD